MSCFFAFISLFWLYSCPPELRAAAAVAVFGPMPVHFQVPFIKVFGLKRQVPDLRETVCGGEQEKQTSNDQSVRSKHGHSLKVKPQFIHP